MTDSWTPGPWSHAIGEGRKYRISQKWGDADGERKVIASGIESEEDALLLSLSPEMAEALQYSATNAHILRQLAVRFAGSSGDLAALRDVLEGIESRAQEMLERLPK